MLKRDKSGVEWAYPLDRRSNIKCEGYRGFYTIIDAATFKNEVYVLLEHNTYGDEVAYNLAVLPLSCLRWYIVDKMNGKQNKYFFIREKDILEESYDSIDIAIDDHYSGLIEKADIEIWTEEEINNMEAM